MQRLLLLVDVTGKSAADATTTTTPSPPPAWFLAAALCGVLSPPSSETSFFSPTLLASVAAPSRRQAQEEHDGDPKESSDEASSAVLYNHEALGSAFRYAVPQGRSAISGIGPVAASFPFPLVWGSPRAGAMAESRYFSGPLPIRVLSLPMPAEVETENVNDKVSSSTASSALESVSFDIKECFYEGLCAALIEKEQQQQQPFLPPQLAVVFLCHADQVESVVLAQLVPILRRCIRSGVDGPSASEREFPWMSVVLVSTSSLPPWHMSERLVPDCTVEEAARLRGCCAAAQIALVLPSCAGGRLGKYPLEAGSSTVSLLMTHLSQIPWSSTTKSAMQQRSRETPDSAALKGPSFVLVAAGPWQPGDPRALVALQTLCAYPTPMVEEEVKASVLNDLPGGPPPRRRRVRRKYATLCRLCPTSAAAADATAGLLRVLEVGLCNPYVSFAVPPAIVLLYTSLTQLPGLWDALKTTKDKPPQQVKALITLLDPSLSVDGGVSLSSAPAVAASLISPAKVPQVVVLVPPLHSKPSDSLYGRHQMISEWDAKGVEVMVQDSFGSADDEQEEETSVSGPKGLDRFHEWLHCLWGLSGVGAQPSGTQQDQQHPPSCSPSPLQEACSSGGGGPDRSPEMPHPYDPYEQTETKKIFEPNTILYCVAAEQLTQAKKCWAHLRDHSLASFLFTPCSSFTAESTPLTGEEDGVEVYGPLCGAARVGRLHVAHRYFQAEVDVRLLLLASDIGTLPGPEQEEEDHPLLAGGAPSLSPPSVLVLIFTKADLLSLAAWASRAEGERAARNDEPYERAVGSLNDISCHHRRAVWFHRLLEVFAVVYDHLLLAEEKEEEEEEARMARELPVRGGADDSYGGTTVLLYLWDTPRSEAVEEEVETAMDALWRSIVKRRQGRKGEVCTHHPAAYTHSTADMRRSSRRSSTGTELVDPPLVFMEVLYQDPSPASLTTLSSAAGATTSGPGVWLEGCSRLAEAVCQHPWSHAASQQEIGRTEKGSPLFSAENEGAKEAKCVEDTTRTQTSEETAAHNMAPEVETHEKIHEIENRSVSLGATCTPPPGFLMDPLTLQTRLVPALQAALAALPAGSPSVTGARTEVGMKKMEPQDKKKDMAVLTNWMQQLKNHGHLLPPVIRREQAAALATAMEAFYEGVDAFLEVSSRIQEFESYVAGGRYLAVSDGQLPRSDLYLQGKGKIFCCCCCKEIMAPPQRSRWSSGGPRRSPGGGGGGEWNATSGNTSKLKSSYTTRTPGPKAGHYHNSNHKIAAQKANYSGRRSNFSQRQRRQFKKVADTPKAPPATTEEAIPIDLSFGAFDFQEYHNVGQRGGGVRELSSLLRAARKQHSEKEGQLRSREGVQHRQQDLLQTAMKRALGEKIKDDPARLSKALAKRRSKKRQSAKKWAKRIEALHHSVEKAVEDTRQGKRIPKFGKKGGAGAKSAKRDAKKGGGGKETSGKQKFGSGKNKGGGKGGGKGGKAYKMGGGAGGHKKR
eukprot:gene7459-5255_t